MAKLAAFGDNVICEEVDRKDDSIMGKVVAISSKKLSVGDVVFYSDRGYDNIYIAGKMYHAIWMNLIRAVMINDKEVDEIAKTLPDLTVTQEMIDKENARIKK